MEEFLIEMHLSGVPMRRVNEITETLWDSEVLVATISTLKMKVYRYIEN